MANSVFTKLIQYQKDFPALTFDNDGYEYLSKEVQESHSVQIKEISTLLESVIPSFVKFNNFKPRKDGSFSVRYQCYYDPSFIGVDYIHIDLFKDP